MIKLFWALIITGVVGLIVLNISNNHRRWKHLKKWRFLQRNREKREK